MDTKPVETAPLNGTNAPAASASDPIGFLPLVENGENEKVANLLARLIGSDERAISSAMVILTGLQQYLNTGSAKAVAALWEPLITARDLKQLWGGQAYKKACETLAKCNASDDPNFQLYTDVCQILIQDPEQEKYLVDRK